MSPHAVVKSAEAEEQLSVGTLVALTVALLVCSGDQRVSAKTAFTKFENNTGWSNSACQAMTYPEPHSY